MQRLFRDCVVNVLGRGNDILFRIFIRASRTLCSSECDSDSSHKQRSEAEESRRGELEVVFNLFVHLRKVGKKHKVFGATQRTGEHIRLPSVIAREDTWLQCGSVYLIMCGLFGNLGHAAEWRNK